MTLEEIEKEYQIVGNRMLTAASAFFGPVIAMALDLNRFIGLAQAKASLLQKKTEGESK